MTTQKAMLVILDGWGIGNQDNGNAIHLAKTPFFDSILNTYPNTTLVTFGEDVGLPAGQMGNSEVGHINLGAGRIVYQELLRINNAIKDGSFYKNELLLKAIEMAESGNSRLHLMGLVSDGGIHSHINHLLALLGLIEGRNVEVYVHAFTDGRDCDPKSGIQFIQQMENAMPSNAKLAHVVGRYYAMDRDKRWERIQEAYNLLVFNEGIQTTAFADAIQQQYDSNVTDEFLKPITNTAVDCGTIEENDTVICFNFRTDRCRQITTALTQQDFPDFKMKTIPLQYFTMTEYDAAFENIHVIYNNENLQNTMGEVVSNAGLSQLRIAETEKYPHVSFFFSGGREELFKNEQREMIPSPKVATYDLQPEMSAYEVKDRCIEAIQSWTPDFVCLNFANTDMVGHTGIVEAGVKAAEAVDTCLTEVVKAARKKDYHIFILADHGNAEYMINEDGSPNTAHTMNHVPFVVIPSDNRSFTLNEGVLSDVAPTILKSMNIDRPKEMTGKVLIIPIETLV